MKTITVTDGVYDIVQKFSESNTIKELTDDSENSVIYAACYLITIAHVCAARNPRLFAAVPL